MKHLSLLTIASLLAAPGVLAQTYDELPAGWTNNVDQIYDHYLVPSSSYVPLHLQYAYDTNDIPVGGAVITELAWHRNNYWGNGLPAGTLTCVVQLSVSPNPPSAMSTTFASNLGGPTTQVFNGTVNWPNVPKGTGPAPYTHTMLLTTPGIYAKGTNQSFVVDIVTTAVSGYINSTYTMAASAPDAGTRENNGPIRSSCKFSNGNFNSGLGYVLGGLNNNGGNWYVTYYSILPNAPGLITLSAFGTDNPGSWPIPLDLTGIGAPNCWWHVGLESGIWIPVTANASGQATLPTLTVPPGLGGFNFYDHGFFLDAAANQAGFVPTWSSKWHIGTLKGPNANTLYRTQDTSSSPTGFLRPGYGTHLRIRR
jgi:hypothetical protein